ncbi:MAG: hypothetical protein M0R80_18300 [Proteobacteria bacterium]|jgi:hypothetical protein|nr:hypothetical protein [Pseudomonadota bacterium]
MQTVTTEFQNAVESPSVQVSHKVMIAWDNTYNSSAIFAIVGTSQVGSNAIVKGNYDAITEWDKYLYTDESDYVNSFEYSRESGFPLVGVVKSRASVVLNNITKRFLDLKPRRFIKIFSGFNDKVIPQFVGRTDPPKHDLDEMTTTITALDILDYIEGFELAGSLLVNKWGDEVISAVLLECGLSANQFILEDSANYIPFVQIKKSDKALDVIRNICEAENGILYVDEEGIIRFENRYHLSQNATSRYTFTYDNAIVKANLEPVSVINKVRVIANPREVQVNQRIWQKDSADSIPASGSIELFATIQDDFGDLPCPTIYEPDGVATDGSYFKANDFEDSTGTDRTSSVTVTTFEVLGGNVAHIILANAYTQQVYLTELVLWGTPAKISREIVYETEDADAQTSIDDYGYQIHEIRNDYIQSPDYARTMADSLIFSFKDPNKSYDVEAKEIPYLQVGDLVTVEDDITAETYSMSIVKMEKLANTATFKLLLKEETIQSYAVVGTATVGGDDVVAP